MSAVAWPIAVPLVGALLSLLARRAERWVAGITAVATVLSAAYLADAVATHGTLRHFIGGWAPPLGISLRAEGIAAFALPTLGLAAALLTVKAIREPPVGPELEGSFFGLWFLAWGSLNALVLSADIFNQYVTLELTTLAGTALVTITGERPALHAGVQYLLIALVGSLAYLLGVALLYSEAATLDLALLGERLSPSPAVGAAFAVLTAGLCLKAAVVPLHSWVIPAYLSARPTVAGLLSGLLGKGPFFVLLRLWLEALPVAYRPSTGVFLGALGAAGVLWGSVLAIKQRQLTALVAYSSLAQVGYLFLLFALGGRAAVAGGVYLAVVHAAATGALFLAAGIVKSAVGHDDLDSLGGVARRLPITFFALALAGTAMIGMPPTGGFVAKWLLLLAALERGCAWVVIVLLVGSLLAAAYVFRVLRLAFVAEDASGSDESPPAGRRRVPGLTEVIAFALALLAVVLGVIPAGPVALLEGGAPW